MHKLLNRQIKKYLSHFGNLSSIQAFIEAVGVAYRQSDHDRELLERSLELTSKELSERNRELKNQLQSLEGMHNDLESSLSTLRATFESTGEAVFSIDRNLRVECNSLAIKLLKLPKNRNYYSFFSCIRQFKAQLKDPKRIEHIFKLDDTHKKSELFLTLEFKQGKIYELYSAPRLQRGQMIGRVWCLRDVTEFKKNQALIEHQAYHDALTNLPNRTLLNDRLEHAIKVAERNNELIAILFIDLDHFKKINDSSGHQVGDQILIQVSERILGCLRDQDTLARVGGDEFVVIIENITSTASITQLSNRIIQSLQYPFDYNQIDYFISCSVGISIFPRDGKEAGELLRKSDMSMYHAKSSGRANFQYFNESLERLAIYQLQLETQLRHAIERNELELFFQPKVEIASGKIDSVEALLRWHQGGKMISPVDFIPVAEQTGLIYDLGYWVVNEACSTLASWKGILKEPPRIAINASSLELQHNDYLEKLKLTLNQYRIPGNWLEIEITETTLLQHTQDVEHLLAAIHDLDVRLAVDDFGTGYSSLSYLTKLTLDTLKVDKSFVMDLLSNRQNQSITRAVIAMAKSLGLSVVAEGVEDEATLMWLKKQQCDYAQGFYFYKPMDKTALEHLLIIQSQEL